MRKKNRRHKVEEYTILGDPISVCGRRLELIHLIFDKPAPRCGKCFPKETKMKKEKPAPKKAPKKKK